MTRTFGLELLESVLNDFPGVFLEVRSVLHDLFKEIVHKEADFMFMLFYVLCGIFCMLYYFYY